MVPVLADLAGFPDIRGLASQAHELLADLVTGGAALGWVDPPSLDEVSRLLTDVTGAARAGDAVGRVALLDGALVGFGYWRRYERPTHRPNADLEKLAVAASAQGRGVGRALTEALIAEARASRIEVLTLDLRGDNARALSLYLSLGFTEYGRLDRFVAVGERRYDKLFLALDLRPQ
jgi:ribosomal protein S18 acetylase RimI-like enzyme